MKSILLISPEQWTAHAVSKHHYASALANLGHRVFFLDPPDPSLSKWVLSPHPSLPNLTLVRGPKLAPYMRFHPVPLRRWLEARWLRHLEKESRCSIDTIWLFENSRFFDLSFAGSRLKIYHQVDLNQNFHPETAAATADVCFCTTDFIREQLIPHTRRVYKIHHGAPVLAARQPLSAAQAKNFQADTPNAVYVGNLDIPYLDARLLAEAVRVNPSVRFHFVGGFSENSSLLQLTRDLSNLVWWNQVPSALIPSILEKADVVLCTYRAEQHRAQLASPHKFMEYLASGKVIVSTYTDEYKDKRHLLEMVDHVTDYLPTLARVLGDLAHYNSPARIAERKTFAQEHTYEKQVSRIFDLIHEHSTKTVPDESRP